MTRRMKTTAIVCACVASGVLAAAQQSASDSEQIPVGTWQGTGRISGPNIRNPMPFPHNLFVQKLTDPHWRWRGGPKEVLSVAVRGRGAGAAGGPAGSLDVARVEYRGSTLTYSYARPQGDVTCNLTRQSEDRFEGSCAGAGFSAEVVLTQPAVETGAVSTGTLQGFALGRWTGTRMTPEGTSPLPASLLLSTIPAAPTVLQAAFTLPAGTFDARNLVVAGDAISFQFGTGAGECKLMRQANGQLEGSCTNPAGNMLIVSLTPPPPAPPAAPRP